MKAKYNFFKRLVLFCFLTFYSLAMSATTITVGTGTITNSGTSYPTPYGNYYKGAHHQFLILASELTASGMVAGPINSLAFDVTGVNGSPLTNFEIKMGTTTSISLSAWESVLTSVYFNAAYTDVLGWNTHIFSTPFSWDGISNIVIDVCFDNYPNNYTSNASVNQSSTSFFSSLYYYTDYGSACSMSNTPSTSMQRPNMQFDATAASGPPTCTNPFFPADLAIDINVFGNLSWNAAFADGYYLYFGTDGGGTADPTNIVNGTDMGGFLTYAYSGLTYNTTYYWKIVPYNVDGSATGCSIWSFTTMNNPSQTIPFSEDWELGSIPSYWLTSVGASNGTMQVSAVATHNGAFGLEAYADLSSGFLTPAGLADAWVKGQPGGTHEGWSQYLDVVIDLTTATNPALNYFYSMGYQYNNNYNNFWVFINDGTGTWTELFSTQTAGTATPYTERMEGLAAYVGNIVTIRFYHFNKYATNYLWLDDITVEENVQPPSCGNLTLPIDSAIDLTADVDLTWTSATGADGYYLFFGTDDPPTNISNGIDLGNVTSYSLSNLSFSTTFFWQIVPYNVNGNGVGCPNRTFTTMLDPTISTFPYLVDFENESAGQYGTILSNGWSLEQSSDPKWETEDALGLNENSTATGPFYDHTNYGVSGGIYVFLESSGGALGDAGNMISPPLDLSALTNPYLSFYYHMYGSAMGELHVDIDNGSGWVLDAMPAIIGQQQTAGGDPWIEAGVSLAAYANQTIYLRFRGLRGSSYTSDMSIDDILIGEALVQAPSCVTYNLPGDSASINLDAGYPVFSWAAASGADGYYFTLNGTSIDVGNVTSYTPLLLDYSMSYTWSVEPYNTFGTASGCDIWLFTTQAPFGGCNYTIELYDSWGDGWNGGFLDVSVNGSVVIAGATIGYGFGPENYSLMVNTGDIVTIAYTGGSYTNENSYYIYDSDGIEAFSDGIGGTTPIGGTFNATCPAPCDYVVELFDSWGDGWNGGMLDISVNGSVVVSGATILYGSGPEIYTVSAFTGDVISTTYTAGSYSSENSYYIYDSYGVEIFSDGVSGTPTGGTVTVSCDSIIIPPAGSDCAYAIDYGNVNDPFVSDSIVAYGEKWYSFTINSINSPVSVSLCNSNFDTKVEVWDSCGGTQIGYNDDFCGLQSQIDLTNFSIGTYYVKVYGYSSNFGNFELNIFSAGGVCETAIDYGNVNDPIVNSSIIAYEEIWYSFDIDNVYSLVSVSLCNSNFDTKVEVWDFCGGTQLGYNDDFCGVQSQIDLTNPSIGTYYVKVYGYSGNFGNYELNIFAISCAEPTYQNETSLTLTSVDLAWTENGTATAWDIEWGVSGFLPGNGTLVSGVSMTTYSLTGLVASTTYDWYVRAVCGIGDESAWIGPFTFSTLALGSSCDIALDAFVGTNAASGNNEWFVYNPTVNGNVNITTCITGQSEDTKVEIYSSCSGTLLYSNDDAYCTEFNYASDVNFPIAIGETYYIFWDDYWGPSAFDFIITEVADVYGCMDPISSNYNPLANIDDGSCIYIYGCMDPISSNYNPLANVDDSSCIYIYGCMDTLSLNYDPLANVDNGTCVYPQECVDATYYGIINEPAIVDTSFMAGQVSWYSFTLDDNYINVVVSLCGSDFNTILEVWDACGAQQYIAYNDDNFVACGIGNNSQITIPELSTGTYYAKIYGYYNDFGIFNLSITGDLLAPWPVSITGANHTILIPNQPPAMIADLSIDGVPIENGDFIGVFYTNDNGDLACGGLAEWSGVTTSIAAFGYDNSDPANPVDGFQENEVFTWKLYKTSTGEEFEATATYLTGLFPNTDLFMTNGMSAIASLTAVTPAISQFVELVQGWSIMSTYMNPTDPSLEMVFASVVSEVVIVKNGAGMIYWPQFALNTIGSNVIGEGYQIKMNTTQILEINGTPVVPELSPVSVANGWSFLGYLRQTSANIATMLAPIVGDITIVKSGAGLVYWPLYGLNSIGDMIPGQGYQIKTTNATVLTYPANTANAAKSGITNTNPVKYSNVLNTGNSMILGIPTESWTILPENGDEIGVFNSSNELIGSSVYDGNIAIAVWGDDFTTENFEGITDGEKYSIKLWSSSLDIEQNIEVVYWIEGSENFEGNGISVVGKLALTDNVNYALYQNVPNPFAKSTKIDFYLPEDTYVQINVYNILGELLENVVSSNFNSGNHSVEFNANNYAAGSYFYKIITDNFVATKQMSIAK